jgi:acyl-coenzyme A thioesterase PaaI-like protein
MDYDALRAGMAAAIPFNQHLGLDVTELGPGTATVRLPDDAGLRNHVVSFPVAVTLTNGDGDEVASATVQWHVRKSS